MSANQLITFSFISKEKIKKNNTESVCHMFHIFIQS